MSSKFPVETYYLKQTNKDCLDDGPWQNGAKFTTTLADAKQKCTIDPTCNMFYDSCGNGILFYRCNATATLRFSSSSWCPSIAYTKGM